MWEAISPDEAATTLQDICGENIVQPMADTKYTLQLPGVIVAWSKHSPPGYES
jgi:hypothetical protein